jgi:hypothetical protein
MTQTKTEAVDMSIAESALGESLAVADGNLALFWGSAAHRAAYMAQARALVRPLEIRGWRLARITAQSQIPEVSP